jgi:phage shock protein A
MMRERVRPMTLLQKMVDRTKALAHEFLDKIEDPAVTLNQYLLELEEEIGRAELAAANLVGTERDLLGQLEEAAFISGELGLRASRAAQEGRDTVAKLMLEEKRHYDDKITEIKQIHLRTRAQIQDIVQRLYDLKEQLYRMKKKRSELLARAEPAEAQLEGEQLYAAK